MVRNTQQIVKQIEEAPLVPVFFHADKQVSVEVMLACYEAGLRVFEFTNRGVEAKAVFEHLRQIAVEKCPDLLLGMGSLTSGDLALEFTALGADFVVSPVMLEEMGQVCKTKNIVWIPGCGSVTEVYKASLLGAEIIKVFPAKVLGATFVKSILPIFPHLKLMPTGGVLPDPDDIKKWYDAGVVTVGVGSALFGNVNTLLKDKAAAVQKMKALIGEIGK